MKGNIYWRMTKESWGSDKFSTVSFTAFVAISVAMISLTAMLFANLTGAIDHLMEVARTPDFLQMHAGDIDIDKLREFSLNRPEVADYQIISFLNLENSILMLGEESLLDSTQDNFPVTYSKGHAPVREGEAALSYLLSEELGCFPGDEILVKTADEYEKCIITGIYSDITNGGKTAKLFAEYPDKEENVMWRIAYVTLTDDANREDFAARYAAKGAKVTDIVFQVQGTYGPTLNQVWQVSILVKMVSALIILLVIMMFVRMIIANQRNMISIKKAMGFRSLDIKKSCWKSCVPYTLAGIILGTVCGCIFGEGICRAALKSFGAEGFRFTYNMWSVAMNMLLVGFAAILAVYLGSNGITSIKALECCKGE